MNLFQVDLDQFWNYLWDCYVKDTCSPIVPVPKGRDGSAPEM